MNPIRVMVVDDSVVVRKIVTDVLSADPDIEVVGTAVNGKVAARQARPAQARPGHDGHRDAGDERHRGGARHPRRRTGAAAIPIIMFSTLTERGASATLDALSAGANDYVTKPANVGSVGQSMESVREQLIPKIKALHRPPGHRPARPAPPPPSPAAARPAPRTGPAKKPAVLVIGSSTGGPEALARVLPAAAGVAAGAGAASSSTCRRSSPASSPSGSTGSAALRVVEAVDGTPLTPGTVHLAPGDHHLVVRGTGRGLHTALNQAPAGELLPARPSTRCSARPSPPTTAPSSASC